MKLEQLEELSWSAEVDRSLSRNAFSDLLENRIPYLRISNFATTAECERLVTAAVSEGFGEYRDVEPRIDRIGNTVFEYNNMSKEDYFVQNRQMVEVQQRIFAASFDPVDRFMTLLRRTTGFNVEIAANARNELYYAGLVRRIEEGTLLHVDYAPHEQVDWEVGLVTRQLAWNLYLRTDFDEGGATHIYDRQWKGGDEQYKEGGYGYNPIVVKGAEKVTFDPSIGEIVIFNTRNYHYVEPTKGERVTVTSAIGTMADSKLVLWS